MSSKLELRLKNELKLVKEELTRTQEDLEALQTYVQELVSFLPIAVCTVNPLEIIIDVNKAFEDLFGYKSIEIVGEKIEVVFLEKEKIGNVIQETIKRGSVTSRELTVISKNKKKLPASISISARKDEKGNLIGYFIAFSDIREIKEFQESLEGEVKERTKELQKRVNELEKLHRLTLGRELKMIQLKKELKTLEKELKESKVEK